MPQSRSNLTSSKLRWSARQNSMSAFSCHHCLPPTHTLVERARARVTRWSALPDVRPGRPGPGLLGLPGSVVDGMATTSTTNPPEPFGNSILESSGPRRRHSPTPAHSLTFRPPTTSTPSLLGRKRPSASRSATSSARGCLRRPWYLWMSRTGEAVSAWHRSSPGHVTGSLTDPG